MNTDTVTLVTRPYGELVDDLLTAAVGGVVNEPIRFDTKATGYKLAEPATAVRAITGTATGAARTFVQGIDFVFAPLTRTVSWLPTGTPPDDDTTFFVDYAREQSRSPLSDTAVGSVLRTVTEAVGREIAVVYQQINLAYAAGFIESATGSSLDHVVAILGVQRKTAEFAEGLVTFFRHPGQTGNITIPAGLPLTTVSGSLVRFVTAAERTLQDGQQRIDVPVRADDGFAGAPGQVAAGTIASMAQPVAGIDSVSNLDPTIRAAADETDAELRTRAMAVLGSLGQATRAALETAIREARGDVLQFFDPNDADGATAPGTFEVVVGADRAHLPGLRDAVHTTRAAGVLATVLARFVFITPRLAVTITPGLAVPGVDKVRVEIVTAVAAYVETLAGGAAAQGPALLAAVTGVADVVTAEVRDVVVARADLSAGADGARIPDRGLLRSTDPARAGQAATDADLAAATFEIAATVDGEPWWISLDMVPADIGDASPATGGA